MGSRRLTRTARGRLRCGRRLRPPRPNPRPHRPGRGGRCSRRRRVRWQSSRGRDVLVMAPTNRVVDEINTAMTDRLLAAGRLDPDEPIEIGGDVFFPASPSSPEPTTAPSRTDRRASGSATATVGPSLAGTRDELYLGQLENGRSSRDAGRIHRRRATSRVDYASTINRAQGATVDEAHVIVDERTNTSQLYVAMTRGRNANHVWVRAGLVRPIGARSYGGGSSQPSITDTLSAFTAATTLSHTRGARGDSRGGWRTVRVLVAWPRQQLRVREWRGGEWVAVNGFGSALDLQRAGRVAWQHVVGEFELEWASERLCTPDFSGGPLRGNAPHELSTRAGHSTPIADCRRACARRGLQSSFAGSELKSCSASRPQS